MAQHWFLPQHCSNTEATSMEVSVSLGTSVARRALPCSPRSYIQKSLHRAQNAHTVICLPLCPERCHLLLPSILSLSRWRLSTVIATQHCFSGPCGYSRSWSAPSSTLAPDSNGLWNSQTMATCLGNLCGQANLIKSSTSWVCMSISGLQLVCCHLVQLSSFLLFSYGMVRSNQGPPHSVSAQPITVGRYVSNSF